MTFSKKEYRNYITEIENIGAQPEFKLLFNKTIKSLRLFSTASEILKPVKEAYDHNFIDISSRYGLNTDEVKKKLDDAWNSRSIISKIPSISGGNILKLTFGKYLKMTIAIAEKALQEGTAGI
ncbi:hypothetical protein HYG86_00080 [Alkalicella caledoniensis]|uniref:Uncharacterized protein n=1 Tax=Alkalicella caledoniensis TaxID=2731377 RepID=A0A7G9W3M6_ALKCA|nr:hypothetical protein [Alkalicella caledoniensis]QNO13288.1 hypothetical protein HYG86_00080 [Alkalicella caledoniensis]